MSASVLSALHFHSEQAAYEHIEALLWPDGPICPHCGTVGRAYALMGKSTRIGLRKCGEIGYLPVISSGGNLFFQLVNARYERGAMILTSNRGFAEWGEVLGELNTACCPSG
jgi:hypothetical protein